MPVTVHLVDATYELFRAHFGAPAAQDPAGREVGAARGLLRSLNALLRDHQVTHVACAFDHVIESFRNDLFDGYKTAEGVPPELLAQFPLAERAAEALGVLTYPMVELEADDALATAAARLDAEPEVERVVLCSPDKDLAQCVVRDRVVCWDRARDRTMDERGVWEKFGVGPRSIPDYLALVGDSADGIPGVPRWGPKSASTLLARYETLDRIPEDAGEWEVGVRGAASLAGSLAEHRVQARLYRELATLRRDAPIDASLDALRWRGARRQPLSQLCLELGESGVPGRVAQFAD
ncbi:MAG: flap endonuclease [Polyangiaceae bacterium]|nr:flap endonuclease [Polyangiaceae bacterium]